MSGQTLITAPALEPVTSAEALLALRVDLHDDDALIASLIKAAREYAERFTGRALITQTWELVLDEWPECGEIEFPFPPLQSVTSVKYTDDDGVEHTLSSANYIVDTSCEPGRLVLDSDESWPSDTLEEVAAIRVRFVCGYGSSASSVPEMIRSAMRVFIGQLYENREAPSAQVADLLLWPYRVMTF